MEVAFELFGILGICFTVALLCQSCAKLFSYCVKRSIYGNSYEYGDKPVLLSHRDRVELIIMIADHKEAIRKKMQDILKGEIND